MRQLQRIGVLHEKPKSITVDLILPLPGTKAFQNMLFLFSSGNFCPKCSKVAFLESRGFWNNGRESVFVLTT